MLQKKKHKSPKQLQESNMAKSLMNYSAPGHKGGPTVLKDGQTRLW